MTETDNLSRNLRRLRLVPRLVIGTVLIGLITFAVVGLYPQFRHRRVHDRMRIAICRLAYHPPPELTDAQWAYCIYWAWNLNANYGTTPGYVPTRDLERITEELEQRSERSPNLATIDWLWDEYIRAYPPAAGYEFYRPTAPRNREALEAGIEKDYTLSYFRSEYERLKRE